MSPRSNVARDARTADAASFLAIAGAHGVLLSPLARALRCDWRTARRAARDAGATQGVDRRWRLA